MARTSNRPALGWLAFLVPLTLAATPAVVGAQDDELVVVTREVPPFAIQDETGRWSGITIELWDPAAALRYGSRRAGRARGGRRRRGGVRCAPAHLRGQPESRRHAHRAAARVRASAVRHRAAARQPAAPGSQPYLAGADRARRAGSDHAALSGRLMRGRRRRVSRRRESTARVSADRGPEPSPRCDPIPCAGRLVAICS